MADPVLEAVAGVDSWGPGVDASWPSPLPCIDSMHCSDFAIGRTVWGYVPWKQVWWCGVVALLGAASELAPCVGGVRGGGGLR